MKHIDKIGAFLGVSLLSLATTNLQANPIATADKPFNEYSWVTTHNSYEKINQNLAEMPRQLRDGVRGFMLDLYVDHDKRGAERIKVCHKSVCYGPLYNQLKNEFIPFLRDNPSEVVTIFIESYVTQNDLQQVFNALPELADYSFNPNNFSGRDWPTLKEMARTNNRLILLADKSDLRKQYEVNKKNITVLYDRDWIVQNHWETLGRSASGIENTHNWGCPTRWGALPLNTKQVDPALNKQWPRLFLMNQFHSWTSTISDSAKYDNNLTYLLRRADRCGVTPNFVGVNNYRSGEVHRYTNALSNGGIYLYEATNANKAQDAVCVFPANRGVVNRKANGCENDEAKSLILSGVAAGTRITLFDHPGGSRSDDYMTIDVKKNIPTNARVLVPNFESDRETSDYRAVYIRNNGLNGKVSRITIDGDRTSHPGNQVGFYEGNGASQNRVCYIPTNANNRFNLKTHRFGCRNDEIRSAKIFNAKAGTTIWVGGNPNGSANQGATHITVLRDIEFPVTIPSFDRSFENAYIKVVHTGRNIDGKISFAHVYPRVTGIVRPASSGTGQ